MKKALCNYHTSMTVMITVNGKPELHEINAYWLDNGETIYRTDADADTTRRTLIIDAFNILY